MASPDVLGTFLENHGSSMKDVVVLMVIGPSSGQESLLATELLGNGLDLRLSPQRDA